MPTTRLMISKYAVDQYTSFSAYATVCVLIHDVKGTRACLCMYMRACVRASVFVCLCFCVCLYALEAEGGWGQRNVFVDRLIMVIVAPVYR